MTEDEKSEKQREADIEFLADIMIKIINHAKRQGYNVHDTIVGVAENLIAICEEANQESEEET